MHFPLKTATLAVAAAFPFLIPSAYAQDEFDPVVVTATRIVQEDIEAPYASEVHSRREIDRSGAVTLTDYLSRFSSVNVMPSFGNRFAPALDLRGYGMSDGHQNVVVTLNGRRLNNIDSAPQLLGTIPLEDVERIEITKGSGSVMFGDGAMAGTIQIQTRRRTGVSVEAYAGNFGERGLHASAGAGDERFSVSASVDSSTHEGFGKKDSTGHRDESRSDTWSMGFEAQPVDAVKLSLDVGRSNLDTRYAGPLTRAQFKDDPRQNNGVPYTQQDFETEYQQVGTDIDLGGGFSLSASLMNEDKFSEYSGNYRSDYDYVSRDLALQYRGNAVAATLGYQEFDGERSSSDDKASKDNAAWFMHGQYYVGDLTLSAGWRMEKVRYAYRSNAGERLNDSERLTAWDIGANYRIDDSWSVFANYNSAYQAPDIDRFFVIDWATGATHFNEFIDPAKVRTFNAGFNYTTQNNRLKVSAFHARLRDEIYFNPGNFTNTNLDRSHKYGFEVQDVWRVNENLTASVNYVWTKAIIDRDGNAGDFNGKELPGVSRHALNASLNYAVGANGNFNLSQTWRSEAWAASDFENGGAQKQRPYRSTDVSYRHRVLTNTEVFAAIGNLFDQKNGMWVGADQIYPVDFERTWRVGANISF